MYNRLLVCKERRETGLDFIVTENVYAFYLKAIAAK